MSDIGPLYVRRSLLRREDRRLLTGQGQFIADLVLPRMLHAALVRSPAAHARIRSTRRAAAAPGVLLILNGADLLQLLPPVPEGQISSQPNGPRSSSISSSIRSSRYWRMTSCGMSARRLRSLSRRAASEAALAILV
jgi:CO/xanthine dehydrogenase Mo-binding subunit